MIIRPMEADDAGAVAALSGELGYPATASDVGGRFDRLRGRDDHAVLVAEIDGAVIGWIHVHDDWTLESGHQAELMGLVVAAARRGTGIGRALVAESERWAARRGCRLLRVRSNVVRERSHGFYASLGFARTKSQHVFGKTLA